MARLLTLLTILVLPLAACADDPAVDAGASPDDADSPTDTDAGYTVGDQPAEAAAHFEAPTDGETTASPVQLRMVADGVDIVPAGDPAAGQAHFHVAVDTGCVDEGEFVPGPGEEAEAEGHYHFGDGSTEAELDLEPGTHELCLQLADGVHTAFGATETVTITVE